MPYHLLHITYSEASDESDAAPLVRSIITAVRQRLPPMAITITSSTCQPHEPRAFEVTFRR